MIYTLLLISAASSALSNSLIKLYRRRIDDQNVKDSLYYTLMIAVALVFFSILSGFDLRVNLVTLLFASVYALVAYVSVTINMRAIEKAELLTLSIFSNAGSVMWSTIWGTVLFKEPLDFGRGIGIASVLAAIILPFLFERRRGAAGFRGLGYCLLMFLISGCGQLVVKLYSLSDSVMENSVFCFYTNVVLIPFVFLILKRKNSVKAVFKNMLRVDLKTVLMLASGLLLANFCTIIEMLVIGKVDLVVYTILGKSLNITVMAVAASIFFKEKFTTEKLASILLLILAVVAVTV